MRLSRETHMSRPVALPPEPTAYPCLVGDIGGTNARFGIVTQAGAEPAHVEVLACAAHAGPEAAIRAYLRMTGQPLPPVAAFGIATPVLGDAVAMTNHPWQFSVSQLRAALGLARLRLLNDFTALALSLNRIPAEQLHAVGGGTPQAQGTIGLIGPGTGLGVSGLVWTGDDWLPISGEGGHVTLPAQDAREARILDALGASAGQHVSAERLLSGPGLVLLHDTLRAIDGAAPAPLPVAEVVARALAGSCAYCSDALETFCAMLGTIAGNLALTLGARGGIYIGGGIVPRLGEAFARSPFRARFEAKGRFAAYLRDIPTRVITAPYPALLGAARALETRLPVGFESCAAPLPERTQST